MCSTAATTVCRSSRRLDGCLWKALLGKQRAVFNVEGGDGRMDSFCPRCGRYWILTGET